MSEKFTGGKLFIFGQNEMIITKSPKTNSITNEAI